MGWECAKWEPSGWPRAARLARKSWSTISRRATSRNWRNKTFYHRDTEFTEKEKQSKKREIDLMIGFKIKIQCRSSRTLCPLWLNLLLVVVCFGLSSCAEMAKDMGLDEEPDIQQRAGLTGTAANPAVLDPFKKYNLVMAGNE